MTQMSRFVFLFITPPKVVVEPNLKHHHIFHAASNDLFYLVKVKVKVDPEVKVRSHPLRSWIKLGNQVAYQSIWELSASTAVPSPTLHISQLDRRLLAKNVDDSKGPLLRHTK